MRRLFVSMLAIGLVASGFLAFPQVTHAAPANTVIKGSASTLYWYASNGKRYVFPNNKTYYSWFPGFSNVVTVNDWELAQIPVGGNVTYRPGYKLVKIDSDPKVYAVDRYGVLRWVTSEYMAATLYGPYWNTKVEDIPVVFFTNYTVGNPIWNASDFNVGSAYTAVYSPNDNISSIASGNNPPSYPSYQDDSLQLSLVNRTMNGSMESVQFIAQMQNGTVATNIHIIDQVSGVILRNCSSASACALWQDFSSPQTHTYYARAFGNKTGSIQSNPLTFQAGYANSGSQQQQFSATISADKTMLTADGSVVLTARVNRTSGSYYGSPRFDIRIRDAQNNVLRTCTSVYENTDCTLSTYVTLAWGASTKFTVEAYSYEGYLVSSNSITISKTTQPSGNNGSNSSSFPGNVNLTSNQTTVSAATGTLVRLTANAWNGGYWNYAGHILQIVDNRNGAIVAGCYDQSWCAPDVMVKRLNNEQSVQFYAALMDANGKELARGYSPVMNFSN